jgi:nucleotide sugar dehydrogenase
VPDILNLKPQEIDTVEKRGKYKVCIVGCGQPGVLYAVAFIEAGFKVTCADADQSLLKRLAQGRTTFSESELEPKLRSYVRTGTLNVTSDLKSAVVQSDIIILTSSVKIDEKRNSDLSEVESNCKQIGVAMQRGVLIVYAGVAGLGFTEGMVKETLESASGFKAGEDFGLGYVSSQVTEWERLTETIGNQELTVAANDKVSLDVASLILSTTTKKSIRRAMDIKIAELSTLFAFARRDVFVALTNELATLCENAGVDYFETLKLMNLGLQESDYAPTINGENKKRGTHLLLENAENLGVKLRLPELARQINEDMVRHAVNLTQDTLRNCGKTLRRSRIAVLGAAGPETSGEAFVKILEAKGARINLYDPRGGKNEESDPMRVPKRNLIEAVENCDCTVILTAEDQFKRLNLKKLRSVMKTPAAIVDLAGLFESQRVESEGFIYRGLGRGIDKDEETRCRGNRNGVLGEKPRTNL